MLRAGLTRRGAPRVGGALAWSLPFPRGIVWLEGPEAGLLAPGFAWLRLPAATWSPQWLHAAGLAGNSGGTAPGFYPTSLYHRPDYAPDSTPCAAVRPVPRPRPEGPRPSR